MSYSNEKLKRLLGCTVGDQSVYLDMFPVRSVEGLEHLEQAAGISSATIGWLKDGQQNLPVYHLRKAFGQEASDLSAADGRVVVCEYEGSLCGLFVDRVTGLLEMPGDDILPLPALISQHKGNRFTGLVKMENELSLFANPLNLRSDIQGNPEPLPLLPKHKYRQTHSAKAAAREHGQLLLFATSQEQMAMERPILFGISVTQVLELLEPLPVTIVPDAPEFVHGLVSWRNYPLPIIDLSSLLWANGALSEEHQKTRLMIVRATGNSEPFGMLIEPGTEILSLPVPHSVSERPLALNRQIIKGVFELSEGTLIVPDLEAVTHLPASEK
jgi:chemotaxis signal transduction protein